MSSFTWADICFGVREQIVWAKGKQVKFANVLVVKMVSFGKSHPEWVVAILSHELVKLLSNMVHFKQKI
jgi:hypothetical protein